MIQGTKKVVSNLARNSHCEHLKVFKEYYIEAFGLLNELEDSDVSDDIDQGKLPSEKVCFNFKLFRI